MLDPGYLDSRETSAIKIVKIAFPKTKLARLALKLFLHRINSAKAPRRPKIMNGSTAFAGTGGIAVEDRQTCFDRLVLRASRHRWCRPIRFTCTWIVWALQVQTHTISCIRDVQGDKAAGVAHMGYCPSAAAVLFQLKK